MKHLKLKSILALGILVVSYTSVAATNNNAQTKVSATATASNPINTQSSAIKLTSTESAEKFDSVNHLYFSTNFVDLSKGTGNVGIDFILSDNTAATVRIQSASNKEKVTHNGESGKLTVDRTYYGLGVSFYPVGINNKVNYVISPAVAFGTKKDAIDVETQNGLSIKLTALLRLKKNVAAEVGLRGDNLETAEFKGDVYAGIGYLF